MAELYRPQIKRVNKIISQLNDSHDSDEPIVNLTDISAKLSITRQNPRPISSNDLEEVSEAAHNCDPLDLRERGAPSSLHFDNSCQ